MRWVLGVVAIMPLIGAGEIHSPVSFLLSVVGGVCIGILI